MPQDLSHGRQIDDAPGRIGIITPATLKHRPDVAPALLEYPPLPDDLSDPASTRVRPHAWFAHPDAPLELEVGCGKGTFILEQSSASPSTNYLGIEWQYEFYAYAADRLRRAGRSNVRMLHADAGEFLKWRCPDGAFGVIHLYFSDPWPKVKHHKNRVVQHRFLRETWRCLAPSGELRIVTDHDALWRWNTDHFAWWTDAPRERPSDHAAAQEYDQGVHAGATIALRGLPTPPFALQSFTPPSWVGEGCMVGTNYEKKKCVAASKPPYACVLRKRSTGEA